MQFVIVGYGRVGSRTAETLRSEGHSVVVVDQDPDNVADAQADGFEAVEGDGATDETQAAAGIDRTDALAALTGDLNANFAACMIAKSHGCRTVLRIDEDYRQEIYEKYAEDVDEIVYPERLGAAGAKNALLGGDLNVLADLTENMTAATVSVPEDSPLIGEQVIGVELPEDARLYAHGRDGEPMTIPLPKTRVRAGDRVAVIATREALQAIRDAVRGEQAA